MSIQDHTANVSKISVFKDSPYGVVSITIASLNLSYLILSFFLWRYTDANSILHKLSNLVDSSLFLITWCFVVFLGIVFCMLGAKKDQRKVLSLLGLILNAPIFWFLLAGILLFETNLLPEWL